MVAGPPSALASTKLINAPNGSVLNQIYTKKVSNESFLGYGKEAIEKIVQGNELLTLYGEDLHINRLGKEACKIKFAWTQSNYLGIVIH